MTKRRKSTNFIVQGSILAAASIISRIIGMIYRIPLTGIIGDVGNGIYSVAYEVYAILLLISSYSLPLAVSKLVSATVAKGERKNAYKYFKCAMVFAIVVSGIVALFTFAFSGFIAGNLMNSPLSTISLQVLAPAILVVAVMGVLRGYFQGVGSMTATAASQLIEQIVNAFVSVSMAYILFNYGRRVSNLIKIEGYDAAYGAAGATMGTLLGAVAGLIFLLLLMFMYRKVFHEKTKKDKNQSIDSASYIYRILFITIVPVILSTAVYNVSSVLDQGIFNKIMLVQGYTNKEYNALWGIFSGKYRLLTNVPVAIASALVSSTVIGISAAVALKDKKEIIRKTHTCIQFTMMITIPCAVGMTVLASPILQLLWHDSRAISSNLFYMGSISVVLYSLSTLSNGILQGINKMRIPVRNALISLAAHLVLLVFLLWVCKLHVYAVVYANVFFALMMCVLNAMAMKRYIKGYKQEIVHTFLIPLGASAIMGIAIYTFYHLMMAVIGRNSIVTLLSIAIGSVVYFACMFFVGNIQRRLHQ